MSRRRAKSVGVYGGDLLPGTYLRLHTGVQRGEELFSRPDLHRPWRTFAAQRRASTVALKEQEIERLLRLCSQLRSELGNARSDARSVEFAAVEQAQVQMRAKDAEIAELRERVVVLSRERDAANDKAAQQIRLLEAQHEQNILQLKTDARVAAEQLAAVTQSHATRVQDIRDACTRELTLLEARHGARVDELAAELRAARELTKAAEAHQAQQATTTAGMVARVEADFKERLRAQEQRVCDAQRASAECVSAERATTARALAEARRATEEAATARADCAELLQQCKQWNSVLATSLDACYDGLISIAPDVAVVIADSAVSADGHNKPRDTDAWQDGRATTVGAQLLCAPTLLADVDARAMAEHVLRRVEQLRHMTPALVRAVNETVTRAGLAATPSSPNGSAPVHAAAHRGAAVREEHIAQLLRTQERLRRAVDETVDKVSETEAALNNCLVRLYFFSDNLQQAVTRAPAHCVPPRKTVTLVCLRVAHARALWATDAGLMRVAMTLLCGVTRAKMVEYGAFECYSDDGSVLLAFDDPVAACRFCGDCQEWLLHVPWPRALQQLEWCREECDEAGAPLFRGLRVAMAVHNGVTLHEPSAVVQRGCGVYHTHYYGATVAQVMHLAACAHGGQILVTRPAWTQCAHAREELRALLVREAGTRRLPATPAATAAAIATTPQTVSSPTTLPSSAAMFAGGLQDMDVLQLCPSTLQRRSFASATDAHTAVPPAALCSALWSTGVDALERRRDALRDSAALLRSESAALHDDVEALLARARRIRVHFHALSPVAMAAQMNDLYRVLEHVAVEAETVRGDVQTVAQTQLELDTQLRGVRAYVTQCSMMCEQADVLRAQVERNAVAAEEMVQRMRATHAKEVQSLQRQLHSRDHAERMHGVLHIH